MQTPEEATREEVLAVYSRSGAALIGLLASIGGSRSDAEDVAQDAYHKLLQQWVRVRSQHDPESWVRVVAVRLLISRHRRAEAASFGLRRMTVRGQQHQPEVDGDGLPIAEALDTLPVSQRAVLILHDVLDLPLEQVAIELQMPISKLRFRLSGARAALGQSLHQTLEPHHV